MNLVKPHGYHGRNTLSDVDWINGPDRKLCHNTYRETTHSFDTLGNMIAHPCVRFHSTIIITYINLNAFRLNTGGWQTSTTKQRLNALLSGTGIRIWQEKLIWYVSDNSHGPVTQEFYDGIEVIS